MKTNMDISAHWLLRAIAGVCVAGSIVFGQGAPAIVSLQLSDLTQVKRALAQIETGATQEGRCAADRLRGSQGEVSRYQVLPHLWHKQTTSSDYANPALAWQVARAILLERGTWLRARAHREPSAFDLYVAWNAPTHYQSVGFKPLRVHRAIADRATRFANLVEETMKPRATI